MESDSTVITTSPIQSNDSMPPTPNSVENSSANSPTNNHFNNIQTTKQIKREVTILTNNQPIMTSQSNRRRHYSASSSSSLDDDETAIDVVNETSKKSNKHVNKKLNSNSGLQLDNATKEFLAQKIKLKSESPTIQKSTSLNGSINGNSDHKIKLNGNSTTILHSPNSNSSTNSQFDSSTTQTTKLNSAANLIANLDPDQANRKFKTFLIDDILSQEQKQQQQKLLLLHQQQLFLQQFNNSNNSKLISSALPLSPSTTNQSSPNSVHNLVNNSESLTNLQESMSAAAAMAAYNSLTNSIMRPWDLANVAAAATLSQLTSGQANSNSSNSTNAANNLSAGLTPSLALTIGSNVQTNSSSNHQQLNNHLSPGSLLQLNNSNQLAMAALAANQSNHNKLSMQQQLQQLSRFGYPNLVPGSFPSSLSHLSAHHQFLAAGLNGSTASLFPSLANNLSANAINAALKNDPSFRLQSLANSFTSQNLPTQTTATDANLMQHLMNNNNSTTAPSTNLTNGQINKSKSLNTKSESKSLNENGKRLNVEDLDDDYENDTSMNDDDCDDKCSLDSSTNDQTKPVKLSNGDDSSPLSALYELAHKNFDVNRNEKPGKFFINYCF